MPGFRRAQLRGSDELFRSTGEAAEEERVESSFSVPEKVTLVPSAPEPGTRSVRLSEAEIALIAEALHRMKYPKPGYRPSVEEFERYEDLRRKLLDVL